MTKAPSGIRLKKPMMEPLSNMSVRKIMTEGRKEVLLNDALNTFYLQLYGVGYMVKDHLDN